MRKEPEFKPWVEDIIFAVSVAIFVGLGWFMNDLFHGRF